LESLATHALFASRPPKETVRPLGKVTEYAPTPPEIAITVGVYAVGFLVLTMLYKMVLSVRERLEVT